MTWCDKLAEELERRGVPARRREAIVLEIEDHIACEPASVTRLGDPRELAGEFADQLGAHGARGATAWVFGALTVTAIALIASQLAIGPAGGYPGYDHGRSVVLVSVAVLGMFVASQVALVAGSLALLRVLRHRREPVLPRAEIGLVRSRAWVGLGGGLACAVGLELYVVNFTAIMPAWYLGIVGGLAGLATLALSAAGMRLRATGGVVVATDGPAGDIFDDLPPLRGLRGRPWRLCGLVAGGVGLAMTGAVWHAERSLAEGLERGVVEGGAAAIGFLALGRAIGARR